MSWQDFLTRHRVGDVIEGVVTKQVPFGSFVESEGFTGLAHEQSWPVGTRVSVKILAIDTEKQRFSLAPA
jgi:small subunit ribosomal protein S1